MAKAHKPQPFTQILSSLAKVGFTCLLLTQVTMAEPVANAEDVSCYDPSSLNPMRIGEPTVAMGVNLVGQGCEAKRGSGDSQSQEGFCGCLAQYGKSMSGSGFARISVDRIHQLEKSLVHEALDKYTERYFEESEAFADLYLSAVKSGLFQENEMFAHMTAKTRGSSESMTLAEFNAHPNKERNIRIAEHRVALCSGQELDKQFENYERRNYCTEGMQAFKASAAKAMAAKPELLERYNSLSTTDGPATYSQAVQEAEQNKGFGTIETDALKSLADLISVEEGSADHERLLEDALQKLKGHAPFAKSLESKYETSDTRAAILSFIRENSTLRSASGEELGKAIILKMNDAQRNYFSKGLTQCAERNRKFKLFCNMLKPGHSPVHISSLIDIDSALTPEIVESIAEREGLEDNEKMAMMRDLDVMTCVGMGSRENLCRSTAPTAAVPDFTYFFKAQSDDRRGNRLCISDVSLTNFYHGYRRGGELDGEELAMDDIPSDIAQSDQEMGATPQGAALDLGLVGRSPASLSSGSNDFLAEGRGAIALENDPSFKESLGRVFDDIGDTESRSVARNRGGFATKSVPSPSINTSVTGENETPTISASLSNAFDKVKVDNVGGGVTGATITPVVRAKETAVSADAKAEEKFNVASEKEIAKLSDKELTGKESALEAEIAKLKAELAKLAEDKEEEEAELSDNAGTAELAALKEQIEKEKEMKAMLEAKERELARVKVQRDSRQMLTAKFAEKDLDTSARIDTSNNFVPNVANQNNFVTTSGGTLRASGGGNAYAARVVGQDNYTPLTMTAASKSVSVGVDSANSAFEKLPADISSQISERLAKGEEVVYATFADGKQFAYAIDPETKEIVLVEEVQEIPVEQMSYAELLRRDEERIYIDRAPASEGGVEVYQGMVESLNDTIIKGVGPQQNSH